MKAQLLSTLENSRQYTLGVADLMPETQYGFKPAKDVMSFGELMDHIAYGIHWWEENYVKMKELEWAPPAPVKNKAALQASLDTAYQSLKKTINTQELGEAAVNGFHSTLHHIAHHRGQAITYLRCKDIAPPEYVY